MIYNIQIVVSMSQASSPSTGARSFRGAGTCRKSSRKQLNSGTELEVVSCQRLSLFTFLSRPHSNALKGQKQSEELIDSAAALVSARNPDTQPSALSSTLQDVSSAAPLQYLTLDAQSGGANPVTLSTAATAQPDNIQQDGNVGLASAPPTGAIR